ncbi:aminoglycoside phosphotransferase family protein [Desertihabitans aurantiacus]|uniref:aminoglycoside phosphotransferase family protein n=1 Tax=Desertihabitans aurantiacus TaxID=2282477 RepID=UPI000DF77146|nr:aminoglycoside phosphotransferase family protein [Desertihabitans aurantiacus]
MSEVFEFGPAPRRVAVDTPLVRALVAEQFPQWAHLPVQPVEHGGWDNHTFHLGREMSVRLPTAAEYALAVEKEHRWLPRLAPQLPVPVSTPLGRGRPGQGYPFAWSVYRWLDGQTADADRVTDPVGLAVDLADFLLALQRVDPADGPAPGTHCWFRGGSLRTFDPFTQDALQTLHGHLDTERARDVWASALAASWDGVPRWFHGDVAEGNLLLEGGRLAAVIDFGTCGVGDPSCDLAIAWTVLGPAGREAFRDRLGVDDATWARGRGWALWKSLATCASSLGEDDQAATGAWRAVEALLEDDRPPST